MSFLVRGNRGQRGSSQSTRARGRGRGRGATSSSGTENPKPSIDVFEKERVENAAKREKRGQDSTNAKSTLKQGQNGAAKHVRFTGGDYQDRFEPPSNASSTPPTMGSTPKFGSQTNSSTATSFSSNSLANPFASTTFSANPPATAQQQAPTIGGSSSTASNPFAPLSNTASSNPLNFGAKPNPASNPFASTSNTVGQQPFTFTASAPSSASFTAEPNSTIQKAPIFGAPPKLVGNPFATKSSSDGSKVSDFGKVQNHIFAKSVPKSDTVAQQKPAFGAAVNNFNGSQSTDAPKPFIFGSGSTLLFSGLTTPSSTAGQTQPMVDSVKAASNPFAQSQNDHKSFSFQSTLSQPKPIQQNPFNTNHGLVANQPGNPLGDSTSSQSARSAALSSTPTFGSSKPSAGDNTSQAPNFSSSKFANDISKVLKQNGISSPNWPPLNLGDPQQKAAVESLWQATKGYRAKVRSCLIRNGLLDDPDKPKKLSEAIDFRGTCEQMCPEFEKVTRIMEHDVQGAEKEMTADGRNLWPSPHKMIKALARSAAGQDAPLPEDVRSPAALRRTLDYLINEILGENDLSQIHGFLWNRTRAIRRDFVFQQSSMTAEELLDHVYCLERITRFHVIALHQMSGDQMTSEDFSEQQEVEQLGKTLLSLIHAYEDCEAQGITCENEAEFRAYYVIFNSHSSGILETVQDWGWKFWGESRDVQTAVSLVESMQNVWDLSGPLRPHAPTNIAQNDYSKFFNIMSDRGVSYTMACFAEIHFNKVRKAALKTILVAYSMQKGQTRDWTTEALNKYMRFDEEDEVVQFVEAYKVGFEYIDGEECLSFKTADAMEDPFPLLKQPHSRLLVERKRGNHSLPQSIHHTVYGETSQSNQTEPVDDKDSLFVPAQVGAATTSSVSNNKLFSTAAKNHFGGFNPVSNPLSSLPNSSWANPFMPSDSPAKHLSATNPASEANPLLKVPNAPISGVGNNLAFPNNSATTFSQFPGQQGTAEIFQFGRKESPKPNLTDTAVAGSASFVEKKSPTEQLDKAVKSSAPSSLFPGLLGTGSADQLGTRPDSPQVSLTKTSAVVAHSPSNESTANKLSSPFTQPFADSPVAKAPLTFINQTNEGNSFASSQVLQAASGVPSSVQSPFSESNKDSQDILYKLSAIVDDTATNKIGSPLNLFENEYQQSNSTSKSVNIENVARWYALGENGLLDEFTNYFIGCIVQTALDSFLHDEEVRHKDEVEKRNTQEADDYRQRSLSTKYFYKWRDNARGGYLRRKGQEARELRRRMAENSRKSKSSATPDLLDEFRAFDNKRRKAIASPSMGASFKTPSQRHEIQTLTQSAISERVKERSDLSKSTNGHLNSTSSHRRVQSEDPMRRSLLSDPSYLAGSSRASLIADFASSPQHSRKSNGVKTDYFRLKARGITTLSDGTPLAASVANQTLRAKRSYDSFQRSDTPTRPLQSAARSLPSKYVNRIPKSHEMNTRRISIEALKNGAITGQKRLFDSEEEALFAKAKRIREQMDEGTKWYKAEIDKASSTRSFS